MGRRRLRVGAALVPLVAGGLSLVPQATSAASAASTSPDTQAPLTSSQASQLSKNVSQKVIVVLRNQDTSTPDTPRAAGTRDRLIAGQQKPILNELGQTKARNVKSYTVLNALSATVSKGEESRLEKNPAVAEVVPDQIIKLAPTTTTSAANTSGTSRTPLPGTCSSNPNDPQLAPQALSDISANSSRPGAKTAASLGVTGSGVKVAFIADGIDTNNADFIRPNGQHVFTQYVDFSGEGTAVPTGGGEAFLDASSIAAQGREVYDISNYSAEPLSQPCYIKVEGVAPGASLMALDIFGAEDAGFNSSFLQAINYAAAQHVNVLNESLGNNYYPDDSASLDLIKAANDAAVAAGVTVTVSSGDAGVTSTIGTPSTDPKVISAGASTTYQGEVQANYGGSQFGVTGYLNDNISSFSSAGFEQNGSTVDVVAPGELNWALCSTDTAEYSECTDYTNTPSPIQLTGGTSESAPLTAGVAALVDQAYAKTHGGTYPTPAVVKQIITSTADDIDAPADYQGAGRIDAYRAVLAAEAYKAAPATDGPIISSTTQFNGTGAARATQAFTDTLTNESLSSESVSLSSRALGAYRSVKKAAVELSDATSPHSVDYQGVTDNYEKVTFKVPPRQDRLNAAIAYQGSSTSLKARVRLTLIDPSGRLADYSVPQGIGNYGDTQVAVPKAGTWTAYIWSRDSANGGTTGRVVFGAQVAKYRSFGTVFPSRVTLGPGQSANVNFVVAEPKTPGDTAGSVVITPRGQPAETVPVTLRTVVPSGRTRFDGTLTGGNGRASFVGQTFYYQLNVTSGTPELNTSITLADNPDNQTCAWLVDPSGEAQAFQSNGVVTSDSSGDLTYTNTLGTNLHVVNPVPGAWTLIVLFAPAVSGTALTENYTVNVDDSQVPVSVTGLNRSIPSGQSDTVDIHVTNTGTAPEAYFVDGRLDTQSSYSLTGLSPSRTTVPLEAANPDFNVPYYLVPSETTSIEGTATTSGNEAIEFDLGAPSGDPDVASGQGRSVSAGVTGSPDVSSGEWDIAPDVVGPFGSTGATSETVDTSLTATASTFDPAVTSSTGDLWQLAVGGKFTVTPVVVQPGASVSIPVHIKPTATAGSTVTGTLYLDDDSLFSVYGGLAPNADTVAAIPYSYKVS